jgi:hypothetical protein
VFVYFLVTGFVSSTFCAAGVREELGTLNETGNYLLFYSLFASLSTFTGGSCRSERCASLASATVASAANAPLSFPGICLFIVAVAIPRPRGELFDALLQLRLDPLLQFHDARGELSLFLGVHKFGTS